jgi:hypothetical protein
VKIESKSREWLPSIIFESDSHLTRIKSEAFSSSSLQFVLVLRNVQILGSKCFFVLSITFI